MGNGQHRKHGSLFDLQVPQSANPGESPRYPAYSKEASVRQSYRVDQETIEGKKTATVKDRARLRDLIKNI